MKKYLIRTALVCLAMVLCAIGSLRLWGDRYLLFFIQPAVAFAESPVPAPPDYTEQRYWAALPGKTSAATLRPAGDALGGRPPFADVFFIHPTSYISGDAWNAPLLQESRALEMVDIILGAQASAFNACCSLYAPHYRQATLFSFLDRDAGSGAAALELAYDDISRAFDEFLRRRGDRPFIVASHSQGTYHALRLLAERVDGSALREHLVGAYLLGYWLPLDTFGRILHNIAPCESATDTGCIVHWSTYGEGGQRRAGVPHWYPSGIEFSDGKPLLCTNPLNWRREGERVEAEAHPGALYVSQGGSVLHTILNVPADARLAALPPVIPAYTWAECRDGLLRVASQESGVFAEAVEGGLQQDYHLLDYNLFYQSVRENALDRVNSFRQPEALAGLEQAREDAAL